MKSPAFIVALGAVTQACAQAPVAGEPSLKAVTVTVTRGVEQSAFDAPASVDIIDSATIRNGQPRVNLSETLVRVPGLVAQNRQNYAQDLQISSRGFGARSTFGVRGLRLYADGIPASGPDGQGQVSHFDLASAARIEVLRGPFSALYGNSSGGVISIFTADGGPDTVAEVSTAFGSDGLQRTGVQLSGQQGKLQYNISAARFSTDGYRDHSAARRESFNGKIKYSLADDTKLTFVANSVRMPDVQDPLGLTRAEMESSPRQATAVAATFNTRKSVDQLQAGAVLEHRIGGGHSVQITAYRGERETQQFQAIPVAVQAPATHPGGVIDLARRYQGLDARWISKTRLMDKPLTLTAGLAVDEAKEQRRGFQNFIGPALGVQGVLRRDEANSVRSFDQYLQAQWSLAERWSASAGVRHSKVSFESRDKYVVPGNADDSGALSYSSTTPAVGLVFHASDALNLYAALGRGFETPTLNELAYRPDGTPGLNFALQSAGSRQWELGTKASFGPQWQANVAYFQARTADEIVVAGNTGGRSTFQNAGATKRNGVEATLSGNWGGGWSTYLAATYLDATYGQGGVVPSGNRIPGIPRTSLFAELAWTHKPWGLETAVEWRHIGKIYLDDANTDAAASAATFNLRASLTQKAGGWSVTEFIRIDNLAGRRYSGSVIVNEGNRRFFEPAPGRTWLAGLNASYTF